MPTTTQLGIKPDENDKQVGIHLILWKAWSDAALVLIWIQNLAIENVSVILRTSMQIIFRELFQFTVWWHQHFWTWQAVAYAASLEL